MDSTTETVAKIGQDIASASRAAISGYSEKAISSMRELADFNQGTLAALTEATQIFIAGSQELVRDVTQSGHAAFAEALAGLRELASVKTPGHGLELQASLMRTSLNRLVSENNRLIAAGTELAREGCGSPRRPRVARVREALGLRRLTTSARRPDRDEASGLARPGLPSRCVPTPVGATLERPAPQRVPVRRASILPPPILLPPTEPFQDAAAVPPTIDAK